MKVRYDTENLDFDWFEGKSLLEACLKNKIPIDHSCEGMASCGTCRIIVTSNTETLAPRNSLEQEMAEDRNFSENERLACQIEPADFFSFKLPKD